MGGRAVLDSDVLVAAVLSPTGASAAILLELEQRAFQLVYSDPMLDEVRATLGDPTLRTRYKVTEPDVTLLLAGIRRYGRKITLKGMTGLSDDPGDDKVVETALKGHAQALVTFNLGHFAKGKASRVLGRARVSVMSPAEFLGRLQAKPAPQRRRAGRALGRMIRRRGG